ncbi:uncharacterized protein [Nicotiana tomentosiformis]|uniref:uncharacterized protein n=1 Tax=Nicotiana tomentosiformis TaxID=4098 RepID=UPI00388CEB0A
MDHFLPAETRTSRATEFENLKQGSESALEYHIEFVRLSKYAILMLPAMEARVRQFVQGLSPLVINEAATIALNLDMNFGKMVAFAQPTKNCKLKNRMEREGTSKARSAGNFGESFGWGRSAFRRGSSGPSQSFAQSSANAPPAGPIQQQGIPPLARGTPTPAGRGVARGGAQSSGGSNHFYDMSSRQSAEASPDVVTSILTFQSHHVYALIDPGSTLSYVTPYVAMEFGIELE